MISIQQNLQLGELYAGIVLDRTGVGSHHLILLPAKAESLTWGKAVPWAESVGGTLPTRQEQAILYGNLKHEFEPSWYWSCEQHAFIRDCAWVQTFGYGSQFKLHKSCELRVRAVRRIPIVESLPVCETCGGGGFAPSCLDQGICPICNGRGVK